MTPRHLLTLLLTRKNSFTSQACKRQSPLDQHNTFSYMLCQIVIFAIVLFFLYTSHYCLFLRKNWTLSLHRLYSSWFPPLQCYVVVFSDVLTLYSQGISFSTSLELLRHQGELITLPNKVGTL